MGAQACVRLSPLERVALDELARWLRERFGGRLRQLKLFGSRARGAGRDDSDLDVFVAVDGLTRDERRDVLDVATDASVRHGLVLSPLAVDARAWREDLPLAQGIAREGVPL